MKGCGQDPLLRTVKLIAEPWDPGLAVMPAGRRRQEFENTAGAMFDEFDARILPFDLELPSFMPSCSRYADRPAGPQRPRTS